MILHYASDDAVRKIAAHPLMLLGSDGIFGERPHPRVAGSAARFLGRFALREGLLPPEEAIARLTARAADRFGLDDRGRIEVGKRADLVLLDPAAYVDTATYEEPLQLADGVAGVWVARRARLGRRRADGRPRGRRRPVRSDEMPSIAAERAARGMDVLPLKGTMAAELPQHVRDAVRGGARRARRDSAEPRARRAARGDRAHDCRRRPIPSARSSSRTAPCTRSASPSARCWRPATR